MNILYPHVAQTCDGLEKSGSSEQRAMGETIREAMADVPTGEQFEMALAMLGEFAENAKVYIKALKAMKPIPLVSCQFCHNDVPSTTAHRHGKGWVGDECCWDEKLRTTE